MCVKSAKGSCLKPRCLDLWWSLESSFEIFSWTALTLFLFNQCRYYFLKSFHCVRKYFRSLRRLTMHRRLHWNAIWCFRVFLFQILSSLMCKQTVFANNITNRLDSRLITNSAIRTSFVCRRNAKCTSERSAIGCNFSREFRFSVRLDSDETFDSVRRSGNFKQISIELNANNPENCWLIPIMMMSEHADWNFHNWITNEKLFESRQSSS